MSDNLQTRVVTTPSNMKEELKYSSDNDLVRLDPTSNRVADMYTSVADVDTDVQLSASVSTSKVTQGFRLVSISEFKYDLLTLNYDTESVEVTRDSDEGAVVLHIHPLNEISEYTPLIQIYYPITIPLHMSTDTEYWDLIKLDGIESFELIPKINLHTSLTYDVRLIPKMDISNLLENCEMILYGGGALD